MNLINSIIVLLGSIIYDDSYITKNLDDRYPYLKQPNGNYIGPRDYFNFTNVFEPSEKYFAQLSNIEEHMFEELKAMEITSSIATMDQWHYSNEDEKLRSGWPEADEFRCIKDLGYIYHELELATNNSGRLFMKGSKNIQMLRYIDSWGRPPSETYYGHSYWVGSYRGCQMAHLPTEQSSSEKMNFRYCWAKLIAKDWPQKDEMVPRTSIRVGICLPKSCDTRVANEHKQTILKIMGFNFSPMHRDRFNKIIDIYCLPNQSGSLPKGGKIFCFVVVLWLSMLIFASILVALIKDKHSQPKWLQCLSFQENFRRFVGDDAPPQMQPPPSPWSGDKTLANANSRIDLRPLGVLKLFASIAVCIGHCACCFGWVMNSSTFGIIEYRKIKYQIIPSFMKSLDFFMVIGGLLTSYTIIGKFPGKRINLIIRPSVYLSINLARYLRLAPMMIIMLAFMKSIYPSLSDGPMWDYGTYKYSMQGRCQRSSWWRILVAPIIFGLKGNSYFNECLPVSWYLVTEMKIALIIPIFLYLICKPKSPRLKIVFGAVLISTICQYKDLSMQKLLYFQQFFKYGQLFGINILMLSFGETGYFNPINRSHAVAIGILGGLYLRRYLNIHRKKWPFWMTGWFFWAAIIWEIYDFFSPCVAQYNYLVKGQILSEETIKLIMVLKPRLDAILFVIIILRSVTDLAPKLMENSMALYKLSKLSYCFFLTHTIIISYVVSAHERGRLEVISIQILMLTTFIIIMSFIMSFPLYLLFESPMALLLSSILAKKISTTNKRVDDDDDDNDDDDDTDGGGGSKGNRQVTGISK